MSSPPAVTLLTGGFDRAYAFGLAKALAAQCVSLDVIGSDDLDRPEMHTTPGLKFLNLQKDPRQKVNLARRVVRVLQFYRNLLGYAASAQPRIFHILWNNKLPLFDRTALMLYYKLCNKKIVFTAHNVNAGKRDGNDSFLNRWTLKIQYGLVDHIFVHTEQMKTELIRDFGGRPQAITVIPYGINNEIPETGLTPSAAKHHFAFCENERVILFYGNIGPYKGLDLLVAAFEQIAHKANYRLVIAGKPRGKCEAYVANIRKAISGESLRAKVMAKIEYISDEDTEAYFKAADVLALPYTRIYQSGVLFLGYWFGLPVIASNVGSLRDDIIIGKTGFLCRPCDPSDLAATIEEYFQSDLFKNLDQNRCGIRDYASARHSWERVADITRQVYMGISNQ